MKRLLLFLTLCGLMLCVSCDPPLHGEQGELYVKNNTGQTLKVDNPDYPSIRLVASGDSVLIYRRAFLSSEIATFNAFTQSMAEYYGEGVSVGVLSESDVLLKEYKYSERNLPGKQLFKESSCLHYQIPRSSQEISRIYIWTFDILPEDIQ